MSFPLLGSPLDFKQEMDRFTQVSIQDLPPDEFVLLGSLFRFQPVEVQNQKKRFTHNQQEKGKQELAGAAGAAAGEARRAGA